MTIEVFDIESSVLQGFYRRKMVLPILHSLNAAESRLQRGDYSYDTVYSWALTVAAVRVHAANRRARGTAFSTVCTIRTT